jgi:hypothetical protein
MKKIISLSIAAMLALTFAGCEGSAVIVGTTPETPYYDRPIQPGPDYIWFDGEWDWVGGRYVYTHGHWDRPRVGHTWQSGTWEHHGNGYRWRRGRWH